MIPLLGKVNKFLDTRFKEVTNNKISINTDIYIIFLN